MPHRAARHLAQERGGRVAARGRTSRRAAAEVLHGQRHALAAERHRRSGDDAPVEGPARRRRQAARRYRALARHAAARELQSTTIAERRRGPSTAPPRAARGRCAAARRRRRCCGRRRSASSRTAVAAAGRRARARRRTLRATSDRDREHGAAGRRSLPRAAQARRPSRRLVERRHELVEHVVHQCTSSSALRSVRRAALSVAPTVPGLIASASAIAA